MGMGPSHDRRDFLRVFWQGHAIGEKLKVFCVVLAVRCSVFSRIQNAQMWHGGLQLSCQGRG